MTLVRDGLALFPDMPTLRGRKHLATLRRTIEQGHRAAVAFGIQRSDSLAFSPNRAADPAFCEELAAAAAVGVEARAYRCSVSLEEMAIAEAVPIWWAGAR